jgi:Bacteriophage T4-like portal protein (Gp20)
MSYISKQWKPVNIKARQSGSSGGSVTSYKGGGNTNWYKSLIDIDVKFQQKVEKYRNMDQSIDISRALDIIGEDISSENADDNEVFVLSYPEETKESQLKTAKKTLEVWEGKTTFDYRFFDFVREMLKYGIVIFEVNRDGSLVKLKTDRIKGYILDPIDEDKVEFYLYDREGDYKDEQGEDVNRSKTKISSNSQKELEKLKKKDLFIMKVGEGPYGKSILEDAYRSWKQMVLLEDAVVIYRIVRAPERRVFYIDIGKMPAHKGETYLERVKNKMRQRQIVDTETGNVASTYNPASMQEDFFIASSGEGRSSRVETLPGGDNLGRIEDLQFFNKKLALGLRIPPSYMDSFGDQGSESQNNDGRIGTAYISELRYAGYIKRLQKRISKQIFTNFRKFAKRFDTELPEDLGFSIASPQSFAIYKQNELDNILLNAYNSAEGTTVLSKRESMKRYLQMDEVEILENETTKLLELGISSKKIKGLPEEIRMNLIYGEADVARTWLDSQETIDKDFSSEPVTTDEVPTDTQVTPA